MKKRSTGFTLVELLIVISIIAILAGLVIAKISGSRNNANYLKRVADINQINLALQRYGVQNYGKFPTTSDVWYTTGTCSALSSSSTANFVPGLVPTFLPSLPKDPSGATNCTSGPMYAYKSSGAKYKLIVYNDTLDSNIMVKKNPEMVDPVRSSTSSTPSFGVWIFNGVNY